VALHSLYHMYSLRKPSPDLGDQSPFELMENEANRRFTDPAWIASLSSTPETGVLRELAIMDSYKIYLEFQRYKQAERLEALLAAMLSNMTQTSLTFQEQISGGEE